MLHRNLSDLESFIRINTLNDLKEKDFHFKVGDVAFVIEDFTFYQIYAGVNENTFPIANGLNCAKLAKVGKETDLKELKESLRTELITLINGKEPNITKESGFNLPKSDEINNESSSILATSKAVKLLKDITDAITNRINILTLTWDRITNKPSFSSEINNPDSNSFATPNAVKKVNDLTIINKNKISTIENDLSNKYNELKQGLNNVSWNTLLNKPEITDSTTTNSSIILASAKAVSDLHNKVNTKQNIISQNSGFNLPKSDAINENNTNKVATALSVSTLNQKKLNIEYDTNAPHKKGISFVYNDGTAGDLPSTLDNNQPMILNLNRESEWRNQLLMDYSGDIYTRGRNHSKSLETPWYKVWTNKNFNPNTKINLASIDNNIGFVHNNNTTGIFTGNTGNEINFKITKGTEVNFGKTRITNSNSITKYNFYKNDGTLADISAGVINLTNKSTNVLNSDANTLATTIITNNLLNGNYYNNQQVAAGYYLNNSVTQPPNYVSPGKVRFVMTNENINGHSGFKDCMFMNTYSGGDVPWTTAFCMAKTSEDIPKAFIMKGPKDGNTWTHKAELWSTGNFNPNTKMNVTGGTFTGDINMSSGTWIRSHGQSGLYFQTYNGGWYMLDTTWVRSYGNKGIYTTGTIHGGRVENAVWNDYAELFPKKNKYETEPGDIIALSLEDEEEVYEKATNKHNLIVGVHSDEYGHIIGGTRENCDINPEATLAEANKDDFIPVGLTGRVKVKFIGEAKKGMKVVPSHIPGVGKEATGLEIDSVIIGYIVENNSEDGIRRVRMKLK